MSEERPRLRYVAPSKSDDEIFTWESQARQYPATGEPGITYFRGEIGRDVHVDCLLYRGQDGELLGIVNYFPEGVPPYEKPGAGALFVHPDHRRQGIGSALTQEWLARWDFWDEEAMAFTESGAAFLNQARRQFNDSGQYPNYDASRHIYAPVETDPEPP